MMSMSHKGSKQWRGGNVVDLQAWIILIIIFGGTIQLLYFTF